MTLHPADLQSADPKLLDVNAKPAFAGVTHSALGRKWVMRETDERAALAMSQALGLPDIVARVLAGRGIGIDDAEKFLSPTLKDLLPDPQPICRYGQGSRPPRRCYSSERENRYFLPIMMLMAQHHRLF